MGRSTEQMLRDCPKYEDLSSEDALEFIKGMYDKVFVLSAENKKLKADLKASQDREKILWLAVSVSKQDIDGVIGDTEGDIKQIIMIEERLEEAMNKVKALTNDKEEKG